MDVDYLDRLRHHLVAAIDAIDKMSPKTAKYLTVTDMADALDCSIYSFRHSIKKGRLPGPSHVLVKRKLYTHEDIAQLRKAIDALPDQSVTSYHLERRKQGWISQLQAAKLVGIPHISFQWRISNGLYSKPTHKVGRLKYYTRDEVEAMRNINPQKNELIDQTATRAMLHIGPHRFAKLVATGTFPLPKKIGHYGYYSPDQVDAMKAYVGSL